MSLIQRLLSVCLHLDFIAEFWLRDLVHALPIADLLIRNHLVLRGSTIDHLFNEPRVVLIDVDHVLALLGVVKLALIMPLRVKETDRLPVVATGRHIGGRLGHASLRAIKFTKG